MVNKRKRLTKIQTGLDPKEENNTRDEVGEKWEILQAQKTANFSLKEQINM